MVGAGGGQVIGGIGNWKPEYMQGVGPDFPIVRNFRIADGEFFTDRDVAGANKVCVVGHTIQRKLFPGQSAVGQQLRVKNIPFIIIGVFEPKGADLGGRDQDDFVVMPYTTARKRLQGSPFAGVDLIFLSARSEAQSERGRGAGHGPVVGAAQDRAGSPEGLRHQQHGRDQPDYEHHHREHDRDAVGDCRHLAASWAGSGS